MKKILFAFLLIAGVSSLSAQTFKAVKVDVGLGYAIPSGGVGGSKAGVTFTIEPHYRLSDEIALGLRFDGAALGRADLNGPDSDVKVSVMRSYCATGDYYFSNSGFRPFAGAGLGFFSTSSVNVSMGTGGDAVITPGGSTFGFFPRLGFETGHFRLSGEYNLVKDNSHLAAKLGFFFGGGKKAK